MKIDPSKKYQTGDGKSVELLHRKPEGWPSKYVWWGTVNGEVRSWQEDGRWKSELSSMDLVEVREPMRVRMLVKDEFNMRWIYTSTDVDNLIKDGWALKEFVEVTP